MEFNPNLSPEERLKAAIERDKLKSPWQNENVNENRETPVEGVNMGRNNPLSGQRYYAKGVYDEAENQYNRGPDYYEKDLNAGLEAPAFSVGDSNPMSKALEKQYTDRFASDVGLAKKQNALGGFAMEQDQKKEAIAQKTKMYSNEVKNFADQYRYSVARTALYNQWKAAKDQAEAALLGSIFGGIATVAGFAIGGPIGSAIGGAIGLGGKAGSEAIANK